MTRFSVVGGVEDEGLVPRKRALKMRACSRQCEQATVGRRTGIVFRPLTGTKVNERELPFLVDERRRTWAGYLRYLDGERPIGWAADARVCEVEDGSDAGGTCKGDATNEEGTA
jgi:hypothetical protein